MAYLSYFRERPHPREVVIELLWPDGTIEAGRQSLSMALSSLRHQLEPPGTPAGAVIVADRQYVGLSPTTVTTDVAEFEARLKLANHRSVSKTEQAQHLGEAVELYSGKLLPGYYEEWIATEQARMADLYIQSAVRPLIQHYEQIGEPIRAAEHARRAVAADPLSEEVHRDLIRLLAALGQTDAALRQYRDLERILAEELAESPSPETLALVRRIEAQAATGTDEPQSTSRRTSFQPPIQREDAFPTGTLTFLLTDIEGSTELWKRAGDEIRDALATHHLILRRAFRAHGGIEVKDSQDSFLVAFSRPSGALACAIASQRALCAVKWPSDIGQLKVRIALHTGEVELQDSKYRGTVLDSASRILTAAHGGQILCSEATAGLLQRDSLPGSAQLTDLGLFRLCNVSGSQRLFQAGYPTMQQARFPAPNAYPGRPSTLPLTFTRFFGRRTEIRSLEDLLRADVPPLVTMTGTGGTGKTRLALETAGRLVEYFAGAVTYVSLSDVMDARLVARAIADALQITRSPDIVPLDQVVEKLGRQPSLLVLDNFEQLIETGADVITRLLQRVQNLKILITSRQVLGLEGEREFMVPPLATPGSQVDSAEQVSVYESVQLFVDRAQTVRPDFQVTDLTAPAIAALCDRLEGIPLAIELAAARAQVLTPGKMLDQLSHRFDFLVSRKRDVTDRHRTLRSAIDWSYRLLSPSIQRFFTALAVLHGDWSVEAAEAISEAADSEGADGGTWLALDYLAHLRECSLLLTEDNGSEIRFRLMDSLRDYARDRLSETTEVESKTRLKHAEYFLEQARERTRRFRGPELATSRRHIDSLIGNLHEAMDWARRSWLPTLHVDLALAVSALLHQCGNHREAVEPIRESLDTVLPLRYSHPALCARLLRERSGLHLDHREWSEARERAAEALALFVELQDIEGQARSENLLGQAAMAEGAFEEARERFLRALSYFESAAEPAEAAILYNNLGLVERRDPTGDRAAAEQYLMNAFRMRRAADDRHGLAETLTNLGVLAFEQGDLDAAWLRYSEAAQYEQELQDNFGVGRALFNLGEVADRRREAQRALRLFAAAERLFDNVKSSYAIHAVDQLKLAVGAVVGAPAIIEALRELVQGIPLDELAVWATATPQQAGHDTAS